MTGALETAKQLNRDKTEVLQAHVDRGGQMSSGGNLTDSFETGLNSYRYWSMFVTIEDAGIEVLFHWCLHAEVVHWNSANSAYVLRPASILLAASHHGAQSLTLWYLQRLLTCFSSGPSDRLSDLDACSTLDKILQQASFQI
jgi:hypothetical protein